MSVAAGARLGQMQSMAGLAAVLARYSVAPAPGAPRALRSDPSAIIVQNVLGGIPLLFTERDGYVPLKKLDEL